MYNIMSIPINMDLLLCLRLSIAIYEYIEKYVYIYIHKYTYINRYV